MNPDTATIDEVIRQLDDIIDWSQSHESRLGYFAALYRKVTVKVKEGIADGYFGDGQRMERLDMIFAGRYLDAFEQFRSHQPTTQSWRLTFEASKHWWPIVLQHLLLGMNAHINLDLGVAAARTSPGDAIHDLEADFNKINEILAALVDGVQQELARVRPLLGLLDRIGGGTDEALINFSMEKARDRAWQVALKLAPLDQANRMSGIEKIDKEVALIGHLVRHPGLIIGSVNKIIRLGERGTIPQIINILG
ncbi:hypothetical protein D1AOALGA4SA_6635 [Olavius algarvensis Delta 1 endosymbiont]|nr:hypothetical protein D1AOALGA4SA_6635 [Olavius algarvensis Delta 1 endosymbiont]